MLCMDLTIGCIVSQSCTCVVGGHIWSQHVWNQAGHYTETLVIMRPST